MDNALTIDIKGIEQPSPRTSNVSLLRQLTRRLNWTTVEIETRWEELSTDARTAYEHLAYAAIDREVSKVRAVYERSFAGFNLFLITLKGEQEAYVEFVLAIRRFVYAVLDAIEREQPTYQKALAEVLEEGLPSEMGEPMNAEEARERLRAIRHQVLD